MDYYKRAKGSWVKGTVVYWLLKMQRILHWGSRTKPNSRRRKEAELHICIGERKYWGRGLGTEAVLAVLDMAFVDMGLKSIYLRVYRHNLRAIRCYEKCGFKKEAILRNRFRSECGQGYDVFLMKIDAWEHISLTTA